VNRSVFTKPICACDLRGADSVPGPNIVVLHAAVQRQQGYPGEVPLCSASGKVALECCRPETTLPFHTLRTPIEVNSRSITSGRPRQVGKTSLRSSISLALGSWWVKGDDRVDNNTASHQSGGCDCRHPDATRATAVVRRGRAMLIDTQSVMVLYSIGRLSSRDLICAGTVPDADRCPIAKKAKLNSISRPSDESSPTNHISCTCRSARGCGTLARQLGSSRCQRNRSKQRRALVRSC